MDLQVIAQAFTSQHLGDKNDKAPDELASQAENPVTGIFRSMFWGTATMFGGAGLGAVLRVLGRQGVRPAGEFTPYLEALAVLIALGGMFFITYAYFYATTTSRRAPKAPSPKTEHTSEMPRNRLPEPVLSVTDRTTEILERADVKVTVRDTAPQG
jgi:hypothetical protein